MTRVLIVDDQELFRESLKVAAQAVVPHVDSQEVVPPGQENVYLRGVAVPHRVGHV